MGLGGLGVCRWVLIVFALAYLAALALLAIGTFGLFGQPRDPLGAVFLLPLGLPWNLLLDRAPEPLLPWLAIIAPLLNILILCGLCFLRRKRHAKTRAG
jgi:hypothetical protein